MQGAKRSVKLLLEKAESSGIIEHIPIRIHLLCNMNKLHLLFIDYLALSCSPVLPAAICLKDINTRLRTEAIALINTDPDFDDTVINQLLEKFYNGN